MHRYKGKIMAATLNSQETADLALFEQARTALRGFTATKEELLWRITHHFKTADKKRKAVERNIPPSNTRNLPDCLRI